MEGKVAIITGGAGGIGKALAERFLQDSAKGVVIADVADETGADVIKEFRKKYGEERILYVHCDVTSEAEFRAAFEETKRKYGGIDVLCNNAGRMNEIDWEKTLDVNLKSVIRGTYLAVEYMGVKNGGKGGMVINTSSARALIPQPINPMYCISKAGIVAMVRNVSLEPRFLENEVSVTAICPGRVDTDLHENVVTLYPEQFNAARAPVPITPMSYVTDAVCKLIANPKEMNGAVCLILHNKPMEVVSFPEYTMH